MALHTLRIRQHDSAHTERGQLRPETPHDLGSGQCQQQVDPRQGRDVCPERAAQPNGAVFHGLHGAHAARSIEEADAHLMSRRRFEDGQHVGRPTIRQDRFA